MDVHKLEGRVDGKLPDQLLVEQNMALFGQPWPSEPPFVMDNPGTKLGINLLKEELEELKFSMAINDLDGVRDALADIRYVLNGMVLRLGLGDIHADDYLKVHQSNMSKLCSSEEEAKDTVNAYESGTHPDKEGKVIKCHYRPNGFGEFVVYEQQDGRQDGKYLKSIKYSPPKFVPLSE